MEAVVVVAVARLHEYRRVGEAFRVHLAVHVIEVHPFADVPSRVLYRRVAVHVAQLPETEAVAVVARVRESVYYHRRRVAVEHLADTAVQLVVGYRGPERLLLVGAGCTSVDRAGSGLVLLLLVLFSSVGL